MQDNVSLWSFIVDAGLVVKTVLLLLMAASVISWTIIIQRYRELKKLQSSMNHFEKKFWSGINLNQFFDSIKKEKPLLLGLNSVFYAGFFEFTRLQPFSNLAHKDILLATERTMEITIEREITALEKQISFLATVGSTSPYVGLFGTVWGIMTSFRSLSHVQQATISMVAPGISEALIATAVGLFAAIPATIAYNYFNHQLEALEKRYHMFRKELLALLHRKLTTEMTR